MDYDEIEDVLSSVVPPQGRVLAVTQQIVVLMVLSGTIASLGLISNSAAVVIGAMLVAPLMTPILGFAASLVQGVVPGMARSALFVGLGVVVALLTGYAMSAITAGELSRGNLPGQLLDRTAPNLLDLGVAVAAGAAGGYVLVRKEASSALPGVGIAVALVPPLASLGIFYELGEVDKASQAALLFATNLAAIVFAAAGVLILAGFVPQWGRHSRGRGLAVRMVFAAVGVALVAVPLTVQTTRVVADQGLASDVSAAIKSWDPTVDVIQLDTDEADGVARIQLVVTGPSAPRPAYRLAELVQSRHGGKVEVDLGYVRRDEQQGAAE